MRGILLFLFMTGVCGTLSGRDFPYNHDLALQALNLETLNRDSAIQHWTTIYDQLEADADADAKYKGDVALILSKAYNEMRNSDSLLLWNNRAREIYESIGDERGLAEVLYQKGYHAILAKKYDQALKDVLAGLDVMESMQDDHGIALGHLHLSRIFHFNYNLPESIKYGLLAAEHFEGHEDPIHALDSWSFAAHALRVQGDSSQASFAFDKAEKAAHRSGIRPLIALSLKDWGFFFMEFNDFEKSETYFVESLSYMGPRNSRHTMICKVGLGELYLKMNRYEECIAVSKEALEEVYRLDEVFFLSQVPAYIAKSYEQLERYDSAYKYMNITWQYSDSLFFKEQDKALSELSIKYESEKKDLQIRKQRREKMYVIGLMGLLGLLGFFGWKYNQRKLKFAKILQEKNEEREALKTRLYTNMTHEFRTPLTVIMGINDELVEATKDLDLPAPRREKMLQSQNLIRRNSKNLLTLVNQLLDLSKSESNALKLKLIQADIIPYLNYLTESFFSKARENDIRLLFYSDLPALVMDYDEQKIQHIAYNLLSNAIKFSRGQGKIVMHAAQVGSKEAPLLQLIVKDNGIGIAPEKVPHIFDRFYQVDDSHTRLVEGSGIGLALTRDMVELMNGEITVASKPGEGTTFTILLPITTQAEKRDTTASMGPVQTNEKVEYAAAWDMEDETEQGSDQPILLIVEDNRDVFSYLKMVLSQTYRILAARNGEEGIEKAREAIPDLIISDVMMPIKDGYELTNVLKQDPATSHIPIILLTAKASHEERVEGLGVGADAYLTKPFDKQELLIRINNLIATRQIMQQHFAPNDNGSIPDAQPDTQSPAIAQQQDFVDRVNAIIQEHLALETLNADTIAGQMGMSQSQVYRKLKAVTGLSVNQFIRRYRLQQSIPLLENSDKDVAQIAYEVGFSSPSYFSRSFHKVYHKSPLTYRKTK